MADLTKAIEDLESDIIFHDYLIDDLNQGDPQYQQKRDELETKRANLDQQLSALFAALDSQNTTASEPGPSVADDSSSSASEMSPFASPLSTTSAICRKRPIQSLDIGHEEGPNKSIRASPDLTTMRIGSTNAEGSRRVSEFSSSTLRTPVPDEQHQIDRIDEMGSPQESYNSTFSASLPSRSRINGLHDQYAYDTTEPQYNIPRAFPRADFMPEYSWPTSPTRPLDPNDHVPGAMNNTEIIDLTNDSDDASVVIEPHPLIVQHPGREALSTNVQTPSNMYLQ
jgi:hypothetical protein